MATVEGFLDWAASTTWNQILSLKDLSNPFTIYTYILLLALAIRYFLVIFPLLEIQRRWKNEDEEFVVKNWERFSKSKNFLSRRIWKLRKKLTKKDDEKTTESDTKVIEIDDQDDSRLTTAMKKIGSSISEIKKLGTSEELQFGEQKKQMKQVIGKEGMKALRLFILTEIIIAVGPIFAALGFRLLAGSPSVNEWSSSSQLLLTAVFLLWLLYQINRSFNVRKALEPLQRYYADPLVIKAGLTATLWSRKQLKELSEMDTSEMVPFHRMKFRKKFDKEAILNNASEVKTFLGDVAKNARALGESGTKIGADFLKEQMDYTIEKQTKHYLGKHSSLRLTLAFHLIATLFPVIAIYMLN